MIEVPVGDCRVCILPVVNGILSETAKVEAAYGGFEAYGVSLGIEGIQAIKNRVQLQDDFEVSELDIAYAQRMEQLTGEQVEIPSPAMCVLVDLCSKEGKNAIALDMNDADFTEMYCDTVKAWDFVKEHRLAKKGMKHRFKSTDPASFAVEWDSFIHEVKGYRQVSEKREAYIADQIRDVARYKKSLLAVIEVERAENIARLLR